MAVGFHGIPMQRLMISCSGVQRPLARRLHAKLKKAGRAPKLDHIDIKESERWRQTIAWWLSACQVAVVLLSEDALRSGWVRYELSVLTNRHAVGDLQLVVVYVALDPDEVRDRPGLDSLQLGEIQSYQRLSGDEPDDEELDRLVAAVDSLDPVVDPPIERLIHWIVDEVATASTERLTTARGELAIGVDDPWLTVTGAGEGLAREFAEAYVATPLGSTYNALQVLAQDRRISGSNLDELVDLNVMTTFDPPTIDGLLDAGHGGKGLAVVTSITRDDLATVATDAVRLQSTLYPFRYVVHWPAIGHTAKDMAASVVAQVADVIRHEGADGSDPDEFLEAMAERGHPVYVFLAGATGIDGQVLTALRERFESIVFVVLSSAAQTMAALAERLGVPAIGAELTDDHLWEKHVEHERDLATDRRNHREDLQRVKRARL